MAIPAEIPLTEEGYAALQLELAHLKQVERPKVITEIADARAHGDLKENAEYHAAREKQGFVEARIADLEDKLIRVKVITIDVTNADVVRFGAYVTVSEEISGESKTYRIVGDLEADISKSKISLSSPIARALIGKKVDDLVSVSAPKGTMEYLVTHISYTPLTGA